MALLLAGKNDFVRETEKNHPQDGTDPPFQERYKTHHHHVHGRWPTAIRAAALTQGQVDSSKERHGSITMPAKWVRVGVWGVFIRFLESLELQRFSFQPQGLVCFFVATATEFVVEHSVSLLADVCVLTVGSKIKSTTFFGLLPSPLPMHASPWPK